MGKRAPPAPSIVGWFFLLPSMEYAAGSVAPEVCHLALAAARGPPGARHGAALNDNKLATIPSEQAAVGLAGP